MRRLKIIDIIILSPPYSKCQYAQAADYSKLDRTNLGKEPWNWGRKYSDNPDNIGNLRYGEL